MQRTTVSAPTGVAGRNVTPVEVVGLQSQLTIPSRHQPDLVDLWIEVNWPHKTPQWDEEFDAAAAVVCDNSPPFGTLSLETLGQYRGWIVARRVQRDRDAHHAVEACVRALVETANQRCDGDADARTPEQPNARWTVRTLALLGSLSAVFSSHAQ